MPVTDNKETSEQLTIRQLGEMDYTQVWQAMSAFTDRRDASSCDEIWFVQHPSVFTQGQAGKAEHILAAGNIPIVYADRGGQVTYHGPGQLVAYLMINLKRKGVGVRHLVTVIESAIVEVLAHYGIDSSPRADAPGVYIVGSQSGLPEAKIAQLGLRVRRGCSFHGLSLNVDMDLEPFQRINPCGHAGLDVTRMEDHCDQAPSMAQLSERLIQYFAANLDYTEINPPLTILPN